MWHTDLDFLLPARPLVSILNQHAALPIALNVDHNLAATSLFALQPPALGGLGQLPQTEAQMEAANRLRWQPELNLLRSTVDGAHAKTEVLTERTSVEFINFLLAGMIVSIELPAVFWYACRVYSVLLSGLIALTIVHLGVDYATTGLLIKYSTCLDGHVDRTIRGNVSNSLFYEEIKSSLMLVKSPVLLPAWTLFLFSAVAFIPTLCNVHCTYVFGMSAIRVKPASKLTSASSEEGGLSPNRTSRQTCIESRLCPHKPKLCSRNCKPPLQTSYVLLGISCTMLSGALRIPTQCELVRLFWNNKEPLCMVSMVLFVFQFTAWVTAWVGFSSQQTPLFQWQTHTCTTDISLMQDTIVRNHENPVDTHQNRCLSTKNISSRQQPDSLKAPLTTDLHLCGPFPISKPKRNGCFTPKLTMENKVGLSNFEEPSPISTFGSHMDENQQCRDIACSFLTGSQSKNTIVDVSKCVSSIDGQLSEKSNTTKSSAQIDISTGLPYTRKYGCFGNSTGLYVTPSELSQPNAPTNELKSFTDDAGLQFIVYTVDEVSPSSHHFYNGAASNRDPKLLAGLEGLYGEKLDIKFQHFNHGYSVSSDKVYIQPPINHARPYMTDSSGSSDSACNLNETHIGLSPPQPYQIQLAPMDTNYQTTEGQESLDCRLPLTKPSVSCSKVSYACVHDGQSYTADRRFSRNFEQFNHETRGNSRFWKIENGQSKQLSESISSSRAFENNLCSQV
ncbi:hypothetical protein PHET_05670 [Paragonimus heterotremus]|uniref:Uncharacterized protein n=1 Tax=Paragonimus heterotremus TaxID=100268 RepID=A0A8J4TGF4_9TREM|nr:hypothetical protein PHET_05670 [Paragonimus heterotremus]